MVFAWVGLHAEGVASLDALLALGAPIRLVLTLRADLAAKKQGVGNYAPVCASHGVALQEVTDLNDPRALRTLRELAPDVVFVIGWPQIVRPPALATARLGMIGAHASLLPHNRGSAPLNWALIHGERETGTTLFWLGDDPAQCEIIDQRAVAISRYDTSATLHQRVATANRDMLLALLPRLLAGERPGRLQPAGEEPPLRRRRPADGDIPWAQPHTAVYDFIRALTRPYPGAFSCLDGRRWRVWSAALPVPALAPPTPDPSAPAPPPGAILGPVVSPADDACGQVVACGQGALILLEVESDEGITLRGRRLSEQPWTGRVWHVA